jgi:hypothetical protein
VLNWFAELEQHVPVKCLRIDELEERIAQPDAIRRRRKV